MRRLKRREPNCLRSERDGGRWKMLDRETEVTATEDFGEEGRLDRKGKLVEVRRARHTVSRTAKSEKLNP